MVDRNTKIRGGQIFDGEVTEAKLDISNAPVDGYVLRFDSGTGRFEWIPGNDAVTEVPSGVINGINQSFTITNTPLVSSMDLYLNGLYQEEGAGKDYQLSGTSITFVAAPSTGDILVSSYFKQITAPSSAHTQNTDQFLDFGGANQSTAADVKTAVTNNHVQGTDTTLGAMTADINMGSNSINSIVNLVISGNVSNGTNSTDVGNLLIGSVVFIIDGGDLAITVGVKGQLEIPFNCTIQSITLVAAQTGSIVVDIKKSTFGAFPTTTSIVNAGTKPTLSSAQKVQDTALAGYTIDLNAGDILEFLADSVTTIQRCSVLMRIIKR